MRGLGRDLLSQNSQGNRTAFLGSLFTQKEGDFLCKTTSPFKKKSMHQNIFTGHFHLYVKYDFSLFFLNFFSDGVLGVREPSPALETIM